jgi:hypothetical protein
MIGFISTWLHTLLITLKLHRQYSAIADLHTLQFTAGNCEFRKKLAIACRRITCRAGRALRKGHGKFTVVQGTLKRRTLGRRHRVNLEGSTGIRDQGLKKQLHIGSERTSSGICRQTFRLKIGKWIAGSSVRLRKIRDWTLWTRQPPPKQKKILLAALA